MTFPPTTDESPTPHHTYTQQGMAEHYSRGKLAYRFHGSSLLPVNVRDFNYRRDAIESFSWLTSLESSLTDNINLYKISKVKFSAARAK